MRGVFLISLVLLVGCNSKNKLQKGTTSESEVTETKMEQKKEDVDQNEPAFTPLFELGPRALVYKTKKDYSELVPVILSDDKKEIVSYPHPSDISSVLETVVPNALSAGYLLDNRGINAYVAFLSISYVEYAKLKEAPTLIEMQKLIVDRDPLIELCDCGLKSALSNPEVQLNKLIEKKTLKTICKPITLD